MAGPAKIYLVEARTGRLVLYSVIGVGFVVTLFFGVAMWRRWMDDDLAVFLSSAVAAVVLLLRWTVLRRYAPRWLGGSDERRS